MAAHADMNRMLPSNLGVVFGPTLMRPAEESVAGIMDIKYQNEVIEIMIKGYTQVCDLFLGLPISYLAVLFQIFFSSVGAGVAASSPQLAKKRISSLPVGEAVSVASLESLSLSSTSTPGAIHTPGGKEDLYSHSTQACWMGKFCHGFPQGSASLLPCCLSLYMYMMGVRVH